MFMNRREFLKDLGLVSTAAIISPSLATFGQEKKKIETIVAKEFTKLPSYEYKNISHSNINWKPISVGLDFARVEVYREKELIDIIAVTKINPEHNKIKAFNGYSSKGSHVEIIEGWQRYTGATVMINSAQYMADPYYMPCAAVIQNGQIKGPKFNKTVRGMLVAEPKDGNLPAADLLDFEYDNFDLSTTPYTEGVQHWPILLDRNGKIKTKQTLWQANRTVVAKDYDKNLLFMTTEGGYFTLFNFGRFLRDSNQRSDKGFNIHTAMNMDGGYEANMVVKSNNLNYVTYGEFETYGPGRDATVFGAKIELPGVIGVFPR